MFSYKHARPALTVDSVVFGVENDELQVLLVQRAQSPFAGDWALPGGFVDMDETTETAARRELEEETGVKNVFLEQLCTFCSVDRDPRERVVSVAYFALVPSAFHKPMAASDAKLARWFNVEELPTLAFDHDNILAVAQERLRNKIRYQPIGFELLPERFPLRDLRKLYELILGCELDKRTFRKKMLTTGLLKELRQTESGVAHRAARLYRFDRKKNERLSRKGFHFEV